MRGGEIRSKGERRKKRRGARKSRRKGRRRSKRIVGRGRGVVIIKGMITYYMSTLPQELLS